MFPTRIRASGAGIVFCATSVGIIASYYIAKIDFQIEYIFGILGLWSIIIMSYLDETKGKELIYDVGDKFENN